MGVKVAINGFGRIGRYLIRACVGCSDLNIVAVNSRVKPEILAHLLKYDSVHGQFDGDIRAAGDYLYVGSRKIRIIHVTSDIVNLPWAKLGIDIVLESTGRLRRKAELEAHIAAGAKKVIVAAPGEALDGTFVMGVNEHTYDPEKHHIISNASCTTHCFAPVVKVIHDHFQIAKGMITDVHSSAMDPRLLDGSREDLRQLRGTAMSILPTSTETVAALAEVIPALKGKLEGTAIHFPTPSVSLGELTVEVGCSVTVEGINGALKNAADGPLKGIMAYCEEELVSVDFISSPYSSVVDAPLTKIVGGNLVRVFAWHDNESGYACRMRDLAIHIGKNI